MNQQNAGDHGDRRIAPIAGGLMARVQGVADEIARPLKTHLDGQTVLAELKRRVEELEIENARLRAELAK